jgi:cytochrome c
MPALRRTLAAALLGAALCGPAAAAPAATASERREAAKQQREAERARRGAEKERRAAEAMLANAARYFKARGKEKLVAAVAARDPRFAKGDLYVVVYAIDGTILAHPLNPKLSGKNLVTLPDIDGKPFRQEFIEVARSKGTGWVDYRYPNPKTAAIEPKTAKVQRLDETAFAICGLYRR